MEIIYSTFTDSKRQFNAMNNSKVLNDYKDNDFVVQNYIEYITSGKNEKGEAVEKHLLAFETPELEYFGTVSENIIECFKMIEQTFGKISAENPVEIHVFSEKSRNGRDFLQLSIK